jgi:hypothetical protein
MTMQMERSVETTGYKKRGLNNMEEEWRAIDGYEGLYEVSNTGRFKSLTRTLIRSNGRPFTISEEIMKVHKDSAGYPQVKLCRMGKHVSKSCHRIVAYTFIPITETDESVNHIDEDKTNNHVDNLEWCTSKYNAQYGTARKRAAVNCQKPVARCNGDNIIGVYPSRKAVEVDGYTACGVSACVKGRYTTHKGYTWKNITEEEYECLK